MDSNVSFGNFGSGITPEYRKRPGKKRLTVVVLFLVALVLPISYLGWNRIYREVLENVPPKIIFPERQQISGIGIEPGTLEFVVEDDMSGVDEILVRARQTGLGYREIFKQQFKGSRSARETVKIKLDGKRLKFVEGDVELVIVAFDKSFWSNKKVTTLYLQVDYTKPKLEVLSPQLNGVQGGVQLLFYSVVDIGEFKGLSGVKGDRDFYPGFPAAALDTDFKDWKNIYFSFFPIDLNFNSENDHLRLVAGDSVGNASFSSFSYKVRKLSGRSSKFELVPDFLTHRVEELYRRYLLQLGHDSEYHPAETFDERIERFRTVTKNYTTYLNDRLEVLLSRPKTNKLWRGIFVRPVRGRIKHRFAEKIDYFFEDLPTVRVVSTGIDWKTGLGENVRAVNNGVVIFSGDIGTYGKTLILDHGFGLVSIYAHLGQLNFHEGSRVKMGDIIGVSGDTGLAFFHGLHFEFRMHGEPVRPAEWFDHFWVRDHIQGNINEVKTRLGLKVSHFGRATKMLK